MKVVQLGCGITGLVCAEHVSKNRKVDELVLADLRTDAAERLAAKLKNDRLAVQKVDATDPKAVKKLLKDADILVSSVTSELNLKVMEQMVAVGVNYLDYSVATEVIKDFDAWSKKCEDAGVTAVTGMGADPGISDIFARYGANKLDEPEEAHVYDGDNGSAEGFDFFTLWSPLDMLEEVTIPAAVFRNGKHEFVPPLHQRQIYGFPEPIGPLPVYNTTHEETFMMPMFIKGLRHADFRIAVDDGFAQIANTLRRIGLHQLKPIDVRGVKVRPLDVVVALMPRPVELAGKVKGSAGIVVEVVGKKNGKRMMAKTWSTMKHEDAARICGSNATGYMVGTGGAIGVDMLIDGEISGKGLFAPEMLSAEKYVARMPAKGLEVKEQLTPL